ncbi:hypothetical protein [Calothrix sp. UHCC 0171]|uniref:hypothetical protein n=1 Tax=Calothrix sp. UHCC 0171 TaxID=3110245 RepID=UPI002B206F47|nr:hypothetical protein [Calothrix sp. UHCC 0171]MEA5573508.1 hypothetical protein [Calothrix sp. UHCC 0171]
MLKSRSANQHLSCIKPGLFAEPSRRVALTTSESVWKNEWQLAQIYKGLGNSVRVRERLGKAHALRSQKLSSPTK